MPNTLEAGYDRLDPNIEPIKDYYLPNFYDQRVLGADISHFNGTFRFDQTCVFNESWYIPIEFFVIRSGQFDTAPWDDVQFERNMRMAKDYGFPRSVYHVIGPSLDPISQADHCLSLLEKTGLPEGPIYIDLELRHSQSPAVISRKTIQMYTRLSEETGGHRIGIYTGKWFTDAYMEKQSWMYNVPWWIARWVYPSQTHEHPGMSQADMPFDVPLIKCEMQQTGSMCDGVVTGSGLDGNDRIDINRWMYSRQNFYETFQVEVPDTPDDLVERVDVLERQMFSMLNWREEIKRIS